MKRILLLNYEFPPLGGGASPVSYELAEYLSQTGEHDIDVVTMHYKGLPRYEEVNPHFRIHRVPCLRSKKEICHPWEQLTYLWSGFWKARALLKKEKYDICHAHFIIPTGVISYILKKLYGLPYVITSHGSDVPGFNTDRFIFLHKFTRPALKAITMHATSIVAPSQYLKNLITKNISKNLESKTIVIPNGIDISKFTPQQKRHIIFSSGRLLSRKGFQHLVEAVSGEDMGWEVHIAGDGPMRDELDVLASASKTKVVLHGWLDNNNKEYKDLLEQAGIYVLASEKENASVSLLEAMSAGCAVITTNVSGCPETVGDSGILVAPRDASGIAVALRDLISGDKWHKKGNESRTRAVNVFQWANIVERMKILL
jgi:glycosyltransferase involved in cell wall biosynthesis